MALPKTKCTALQFAPPGHSFELPVNTPEEDIIPLNNVLVAMMHIGARGDAQKGIDITHKIKATSGGYLLRAILPATDIFEFSMEDLLLLYSVSPARVVDVSVARTHAGGPCEVVVKMLDSKQPLMTVSTIHFAAASHKRKFAAMSS